MSTEPKDRPTEADPPNLIEVMVANPMLTEQEARDLAAVKAPVRIPVRVLRVEPGSPDGVMTCLIL